MGMLVAAGLFFIGIHIFVSSTPLRGWIIQRVGARPYQGVFSLLSLAGLVWLIWAYVNAERAALWQTPGALIFAAVIASMAGIWLAALGVFSPNPTTVDQEALLQSPTPARGVVRITRHPFMIGFALWAAAHMLLNPDTASLAFFGTFFVLAGLGPRLIDAKKAKAFARQWPGFASATSIIPFLAIAQGRNQFVSSEVGWWRPMVALLAVGLLAYFHGALFGVALL
ncbi:MAG: NnrU family protein [Alphaproteobacteria bacterium]|nr:NnrU family protein [Alphaproteobacteria bacterium]